ncbi:MAG: FAD-dependent oxidoreductase, partial [Methyloceanibacter sp.]
MIRKDIPARKELPPRAEGGGIVIVGAGLAGLFTALKLAPLPVTVVSATPFGQGGSSVWAQAGIAAALAEGDSPEAHAVDTIRAGAGIVDEKIALLLAREARDRVEDLLRYGVPFDKDLEGHFDLAREAAHGASRILHVKG